MKSIKANWELIFTFMQYYNIITEYFIHPSYVFYPNRHLFVENNVEKRIRRFIFYLLLIPVLSGFLDIYPPGGVSFAGALEQRDLYDIIIVLDDSGSMKQNDPDFLAREVVGRFLTGLGLGSRLGVVTFSGRAILAAGLTETNSSGARADVIKSLDRMEYKGLFSDIPAAVERAVYELRAQGRKTSGKVIILLTDGIVDTGDRQKDREKEQWLREELTKECIREGIRLIGVAFTEAADFSLIQTLALRTNGKYYRALRAGDIQDVFDDIKTTLSEIPVIPSTVPPSEAREEGIIPEISESAQAEKQGVKNSSGQPDPLTAESVPQKKQEIPPKDDFIITPVLAMASILLVIIIIVIIFYGRRRRHERDVAETGSSGEPITHAILFDINNITGNRSLVLRKGVNMIGRDPNNDIVIPKDTISSVHATIEYGDGFFYLEDQRSVNKTRLDGNVIEPNSPKRLKSGDEIVFDIFRFKFILPDHIPSGETTIGFPSSWDEKHGKGVSERRVKEIPDLPRAILVDVKNVTGKKTLRLEKRINKIGRGPGADVEIPKENISGLHATIEYRDGFFYLEDQRSKNRTSLGGNELDAHSPRKLKSGDEILFDTHKFIFLLEYELPSGDTGEKTVELSDK